MRRRGALGALALLVMSAPAFAKDDYVYGPPPVWSEYKKLGEAAIRAQLTDPYSWSVEWPNGYKAGFWPIKERPHGYLTCGIIHAIKPIDGAYPSQVFAVVIDYGVVRKVDYRPKPSNSTPNLLCPIIYKRGLLPPPSMMEAAQPAPAAQAEPTVTALGFAIRAMSAGAYVTKVEPGSRAAAAGLTTGMVITKLNGIALAGMGDAMTKLLAADAESLTLETAAGGPIKIDRAKAK